MKNLEARILNGEMAVYPGHPAVVGLLIMHAFPNLEGATGSQGEGNHVKLGALRDPRIPGAGSSVRAALRVLDGMSEVGPEASFAAAEAAWIDQTGPGTGNHEDLHAEGAGQAERFKMAFLDQAERWSVAAAA